MNVLQNELSIQLFADHSTTSRSPEPRLEISKRSRKVSKRESSIWLLHVVLYGPPKVYELVGLFTATCNLFLQHPTYCDRNVPYRNPQCLTPGDSETILTYDLSQAHISSLNHTGGLANPIDLFTDGDDQAGLEEADDPGQLTTKLYKHQKQALTFMLQRERGWALDGHHKDIWSKDNVAGRPIYLNTISSRRQSKPPPPFRGGLLIDAPGLGKSLSILALVAAGRNQGDKSATLLVVPKTCELAAASLPEKFADPDSNTNLEG